MESINELIAKFQNLSRMKQVIIGLMVIIGLVFIYDIFTSSNNKPVPSEKMSNSNKIEKLEPTIQVSSGNVTQTTVSAGDVKIDSERTNVTLYFADWCGHCKQFIGSTWGKLKETYSNKPDINMNQIDCTNIQSEIKTPAGMLIKGFPTVIINYKNAEGEYIEEEYSGNRSYAAVSEYIDSLIR
jgi:hypothetical protein